MPCACRSSTAICVADILLGRMAGPTLYALARTGLTVTSLHPGAEQGTLLTICCDAETKVNNAYQVHWSPEDFYLDLCHYRFTLILDAFESLHM